MPSCWHGSVTSPASASGSAARSAPTEVRTVVVPPSSMVATRSQAAVPDPEARAGTRRATPSARSSPSSVTGASSSWQRTTTAAPASRAAAATARNPSRTSFGGTARSES